MLYRRWTLSLALFFVALLISLLQNLRARNSFQEIQPSQFSWLVFQKTINIAEGFQLVVEENDENDKFEDTNSSNLEQTHHDNGLASPYSTFIPKFGRRKFKNIPLGVSFKTLRDLDIDPSCSLAQNASQWNICDPEPCKIRQDPIQIFHPLKTNISGGISTFSFVQQVLKTAWGENPPRIDLYVRTGCMGAFENQYLFQSIYLFWPSFIGTIIVVLDHGNEQSISELIPLSLKDTHSITVVYEHTPCMPGRVFNQLSYLNLYKYSIADYVVTLDSDCYLFTPVTPDILFNEKQELYLPFSSSFQSYFPWGICQSYFTGFDATDFGHTMISQPVSFKVKTFQNYMKWIKKKRGICYEDLVTTFFRELPPKPDCVGFFCWMCQLGMFVARNEKEKKGYDIHIVNTRPDAYFRFNSHVNYESITGEHPSRENYVNTIQLLASEGVCFWFPGIFKECEGKSIKHLYSLFFGYAGQQLNLASTEEQKHEKVESIRRRLQQVVNKVLIDNVWEFNETKHYPS